MASGPHFTPTESQSLIMEPQSCVLTSSLGDLLRVKVAYRLIGIPALQMCDVSLH